jgi:hypothetical protein
VDCNIEIDTFEARAYCVSFPALVSSGVSLRTVNRKQVMWS